MIFLNNYLLIGPVNQDNLRKRTESGGTGVRVREADNLRPLIQIPSEKSSGRRSPPPALIELNVIKNRFMYLSVETSQFPL